MDVDDDRTAQRTPGGWPILLDCAPAASARDADGQPPDVIEVLFPLPADGQPVTAGGPGDRPTGLRDRPLLLGALAIAAVGLAAVIAWQAWPQSPAAGDADRPGPVSTSTQPLGTGGISGRAAGVLPSGAPHATRRPAADRAPSGTPAPPAVSPAVAPASPDSDPRSSTSAGTPSAPASTPARTPSSTPSTVPAGPRTLQAGDSGPDVTELQRLLFAQGLTYVTVNGVYDDATVRGVAQVQQDRGLHCDPSGVYGPCTRAALTS